MLAADEVVLCSKSDSSNIERCVTNAILEILDLFREGNKELHFPTITPLKIAKLTIGEGSGAVSVVQEYENVEIHGLLPTNITSLKYVENDDGIKIVFETINAKLFMLADYSLNGKILLLPARGVGKCNITLENMNLRHDIEAKFVDRNGQQYLDVVKYKVKTAPKRAYYQFDNLFGGDEVLAAQLLSLINENWKEVYDDVSNGYEEALGALFKGICNAIFHHIPVDELFI